MTKRLLYTLLLFTAVALTARAQHTFRDTSLSEALIELDQASKKYDISFVYDELEDFKVSKNIRKGRSLPDAVRDVCGFYPVRVSVQGHDIFVECMQKERTKLTGRLEAVDHSPIAYANIVLTAPSDSVVIAGGVSNESGYFAIPCALTQARVRISCVGFKTIERVMPIAPAGTLSMQMEDYYLQNITIRGMAPVISSAPDGILYQVANDPFAKGHNGYELLSRVPLVSMQGGHATILGRGRADYMLNGRALAIDEDVIRQKLLSLQADDIQRIEVLTRSTGRFAPQGSGGYINIVTRQEQSLGWRGDLSGQLSTAHDWSGRANGSLSYATEQLDASLDVFVSRETERLDQSATYEREQHFTKWSQSRHDAKDRDLGASLSLHYRQTPRWSFGALLSFRDRLGNNEMTATDDARFTSPYAPFGWRPLLTDAYRTESESSFSPVGPMRSIGITAYSDWALQTPGQQVSLTYNYFSKSGWRESSMIGDMSLTPLNSSTVPYDGDGHGSDHRQVNSHYRIQSLKLDVALPFPAVRLDGGLAYTDISNGASLTGEHHYRHYHNESNIENVVDNSYQERTLAAYLSAGWQLLPQLTVNAGLRMEYTWLMLGEKNPSQDPHTFRYSISEQATSKPFSKLLPSLSLHYQPREGHHLSLYAGRTIVRPDFDELNMVPVYTTLTHQLSGNHNLTPGTVDLAELSYQHPCGLYARLFYRYGRNLTEWVTRFQMINAEEMRAYYNIDQRYLLEHQTTRAESWLKEHQAGVYLRYQQRLGSWLNVVLEGSVYHYGGSSHDSVLDTYEDQTFNPYKPDLTGWGEQAGVSADLFLNRQHTLLLNARYNHWFDSYERMTSFSSYGYAYFSLRYTLPGDRLHLALVANDPFHQYVNNQTRRYNWFTERIHADYRARRFSLTATWTLGGKQVKRSQRDKKNAETLRAEGSRNLQY